MVHPSLLYTCVVIDNDHRGVPRSLPAMHADPPANADRGKERGISGAHLHLPLSPHNHGTVLDTIPYTHADRNLARDRRHPARLPSVYKPHGIGPRPRQVLCQCRDRLERHKDGKLLRGHPYIRFIYCE